MRTTINIDDGLLERLKKESERSRVSLSATINRVLRRGLESARPSVRQAYEEQSQPMGNPAGVNLDKALQMAAMLEDEEIARKMQLGK